ncbi:GNAT family N-acetyltransferase [Amycolatopsis rubida]|uniref:GNAT family N-acetyltransferase n=1 Tax=Amycolatopsis rubida TaxID=112413 RepID=A0ABX0C0Q4_9PSEU|nr:MULTISPECIES: GNAT family N-acetyltransferase [Amycolatopsis]MYW96427.1 GNAT family N-acetyltransferase [Amycolatopsis rubida]NEC61414.1 GNAT family N-acetyltransferase [Amycolatopsis rubida]OAP28115.1 Acetyltransferase (GNAT) family protein [Amycolatopsis sp. M39]
MIEETVRAWVAGWALSRATPTPIEQPWGLYVEVPGNPAEAGRHVLPEAEESLVRAAAGAVSEPRTWLKTLAEPEAIEPWLPDGWVVGWEHTGHLMATDLLATDPVAPEGYTVTVETSGAVTFFRVLDAAGEQAAKGQMAVVGDAVVVDRVATEEAHRRRGLGGLVLRTIADRALGEGAVFGVLAASDAGRALYETLGWKKHSTLSAGIYQPLATAAS